MRTALLAAAFALHSVHRSSKAFIEGADGCLAPNVEHYERDRFVCFIDGDGGTGDQKPPTFTQEQMNAFLAKEQAKIEKRLGDAHAASMKELTDKVNALTQAAEDAGKSEKEKAEAKAARERATLESTLETERKSREASDAKAAAAAQKLRETTTSYELNGLFQKHKVLPEMSRAALLVFGADAKLEYGEDGAITGVDIGDKRFGKLEDAVGEWMKTNGAGYVAAPSGGAGTRPSSGAGAPKSYENMSRDEIAALVTATDPNAAKR